MPAHFSRLLLAGVALALGACGAEQSGTASKTDATGTPAASALTPALTTPAVATVNGTVIDRQNFENQVKMRLARQNGVADSAEVRKNILDELISMEVVMQDALAKGLDKNPELAMMLENQRRALIASAAVQQYIQANPPGDADIKKLYDEQFGKVDKEYRARHILVKTEAEAKDIIAQLDKGGDFINLAKEKSGDPGSRGKGGDLDWFTPNAMVKPFSDAVATLQKGTYTKTPVQTQFGWHVIKLEDIRTATPPPLDEGMKVRLRNQQQQTLVRDYIDKLRAQAKIEIKDIPPPPAPEPAPAAKPAASGAASEVPSPEPPKP